MFLSSWSGGTFGSTVLVLACSVFIVRFAAEAVAENSDLLEATPSTLSANTADSIAEEETELEETTIKQRQVRKNLVRPGAAYRSARAFTRRPKSLRKDRHRHSTKVVTTKLPIVLLPPVLTFRSEPEERMPENFLINVVSPASPPTTLPPLVTSPLKSDDFPRTPINIRSEQVNYNRRPFVDEKIMAMKNFGMRMQGGSRGEVRFRSSTASAASHPASLLTSTAPSLSDYTPPKKHFVSESKLRELGKPPRRRFRVRIPTSSTTRAPQNSPLTELSFENLSVGTVETTVSSGVSTLSYNSHRSIPEETQFRSISPKIGLLASSSPNDVLNYDIQRSSPRTVFSLSATGPVNSSVHSTPAAIVDDFYFTTNSQETANYEGRDFLSDSSVVNSNGPTGRSDELLSAVGSSTIAPHTEINVATSTSQFVEEPTFDPLKKLELKDLIYPPLNILAPPFHEDNFHEDRGSLTQNTTERHNAAEIGDLVTTPFPDLFDSVSHLDGNRDSAYANGTDASSVESTSAPQVETIPQIFEHTEGPLSRYEDCENSDCSTTTVTNPPTTYTNTVPAAPSDVKVLSERDGIAFITRMYENLLRVLNGGPDYYDLQEDPAIDDVDVPETVDNAITTSETSALEAQESGDIRNSRERQQAHHYNTIPTPHRSSRRKEAHSKNVQASPKMERKSSQLCKSKLGYVADVASGCKVFYVCTEFGVGEPMNCPNGTLFNQDYLVCDWWYNVHCS